MSVIFRDIGRDVKYMSRITILVLVVVFVAQGCREDSSSPERPGIIQRKGIPMTLLGPELKVGQKAPAFDAVDSDEKVRSLSEFKDKIVVISSVPSLDTHMCNLQTLRLNEEAKKLKPEVVILTISLDLPYAQERWRDTAGVSDTIILSDYRDRAFGKTYGLIIKERMLLARAVMIIDRQGIIRYIQLVKEQYHEPDYDEVLNELQKLLEE